MTISLESSLPGADRMPLQHEADEKETGIPSASDSLLMHHVSTQLFRVASQGKAPYHTKSPARTTACRGGHFSAACFAKGEFSVKVQVIHATA